MVQCHSCQKPFEDYKELALHILSSKKGHRKGKKWAAKYMSRNVLSKKDDFKNGRIALTENEKDNRENSKRELSGRICQAITHCPRCQENTYQSIPAEHAENDLAWEIGGHIVVTCSRCK